MNATHRCPHCRALLNPHENIVLVAERDDARVLAVFHSKPGDYTIWFPAEAKPEDGQRWTFYCPVCHADLVSAEDADLCALSYETEAGEHQLLFSRIAGQQATYVVIDGEVSERFGRDAQSYFEFAMAHHPPL